MTTVRSLVAVVPVHDERERIVPTLELLRAALDVSPWRGAEIVVVDDGSSDGTGDALAAVSAQLGLRVLQQPNRGRLLARAAGLAASTAELALLVDARVAVDPQALAHVADEMRQDPDAVLWNADVTVLSEGNPYAGFWAALTAVGWRRYFADRRRTSYGLAEFDLYPKGTTLFLAPRAWLVEESARLDSHYRQVELASDDTALIRALAARSDIHLSPGFSCRYEGRDALVPFLRHAWFRGTTFVDSYAGRGGPVGRALVLGLLAAPPAAVLAGRHRRLASAAGTGVLGALYVGARRSGASRAEARALVLLTPVFAGPFGAGVARGLLLALRARLPR